MLNLLTFEQKEKVKKEYRLRRFVVALFLLFCVLIIATVSLFPLYLLSKEKLDQSNNRLNDFNKSPLVKQSKDLSQETKKINEKIKALTSSKDIYVYDVINKVLENKSDKIRITDIVFSKKDNANINLNISGVAISRESLIVFEKDLQKEPMFIGVDFPVSNLAKDSNINFSIQINVKI